MNIKIIYFILLIAIIAACKNNKLIPIKKMANIMADVHLADSYAAFVYQSDTSVAKKNTFNKNTDTLQKYYAIIFAMNNITEKQFNENFRAYEADPKLWDSLYSLTQKRLKVMQPKSTN